MGWLPATPDQSFALRSRACSARSALLSFFSAASCASGNSDSPGATTSSSVLPHSSPASYFRANSLETKNSQMQKPSRAMSS